MTLREAEQHFREGQRCAEALQWSEALSFYERAAATDSSHWKARLGCALARQRLYDHAGAIRDLDAVLAVYPELTFALYARAVSESETGDHAAALADSDRVLSQCPNDVDALYVRAL